MHPLLLAALLGTQPGSPFVRVRLDTPTRADLERLDGKTVATTVTVNKPAYTWGTGKNLRTVFGPQATGREDVSVVRNGNRKLTVVGMLRVIRHQDAALGGKGFSVNTEVRIEEREMPPHSRCSWPWVRPLRPAKRPRP